MTVETIPVLKQDISLYESHVEIHLPGGVKKAVSIEDFKRIMNDAFGIRERSATRSFSMPSNVYYFSCSDTDVRLSCYYQSRKAKIRHLNKDYVIILPNVIISHILTKGVKNGEWKLSNAQTRYFCTNQNVGNLPHAHLTQRSPNSGIFLLPTTNMYESGQMCFGNNSMPANFTDNNLRGLDWYYQFLFDSPFNDDLGVKAIGQNMEPSEWYAYLADLAEKDKPFPYDKLRY